MLLVWRRPWRTMLRPRWPARRLLLVATFGAALAAMNLCFYLAIDRLPLGNAVAIEFLGPVSVAALGTRRARDLAALALAGGGVLLVSGASVAAGGSPAGVLAALGAAAFWAIYIVLGGRVAATGDGVHSLAAGMALGALVIAPVALPPALPAFAQPRLLLAGAGVGVLSSTIPYVVDQLVLRRLTASHFALLQALLPATAAVVGLALLRQVPTAAEVLGITLVIVGVALRTPAGAGQP